MHAQFLCISRSIQFFLVFYGATPTFCENLGSPQQFSENKAVRVPIFQGGVFSVIYVETQTCSLRVSGSIQATSLRLNGFMQNSEFI